MFTYHTILKEIKDLPESRLEELYEFVHSLGHSSKKEMNGKKILSFAGSFASLNKKDYAAFVADTKKTRKNLFNRKGV
ncbi:MAG: hypothetical protein ABIP79_10040 [Chitinophagaceae bacterium]